MAINIPKNSDVAEMAAKELAPTTAVVILSMHPDTGKFETRIFGDNARKRVLAGRMADIALEAVNNTDPEADSGFNWSMIAANEIDAAQTSVNGDGDE